MRNMKAQQGFTLIEIISVLVILGILAAVAVPKYYDLQEEARIKAATTAVAEAQARINMAFGQYLLMGGSCPSIKGYSLAVAANKPTISTSASSVTLNVGDTGGKTIGGWTIAPASIDSESVTLTDVTGPDGYKITVSGLTDAQKTLFVLHAPQCAPTTGD